MPQQVTQEQRDAIVDLVGRPFERGARGPTRYDCLGLTLAGLSILRADLEIVDPWADLAQRWATGWRPAPGEVFPRGFRPAAGGLEPGDVLLIGGRADPAAPAAVTHVDLVVWGGLVLRTRERTGATLVPLRRVRGDIGAAALLGAMRPPPLGGER